MPELLSVKDILVAEVVRDEELKTTMRSMQLDPTALYIEFARKLFPEEHMSLATQFRADKINEIYDNKFFPATKVCIPDFLSEPGHREKYYCGKAIAKLYLRLNENENITSWLFNVISVIMGLAVGSEQACAFYEVDLFYFGFNRHDIKETEKISNFIGLFQSFVWVCLVSAFMVRVKRLYVK